MRNNYLKEMLTILLVVVLIAIYYLFTIQKMELAIMCVILFVIILIYLAYTLGAYKTDKDIYNYNLQKIFREYSSILVESSIPNLENKDIIYVRDIENLANAHAQLRQPIYFIRDGESCAFIILDHNNALVYIYKKDIGVFNRVENLINELKGYEQKEEPVIEEEKEVPILEVPSVEDPTEAPEITESHIFPEEEKEEDVKKIDLTADDAFANISDEDLAYANSTLAGFDEPIIMNDTMQEEPVINNVFSDNQLFTQQKKKKKKKKKHNTQINPNN